MALILARISQISCKTSFLCHSDEGKICFQHKARKVLFTTIRFLSVQRRFT